MGETLAASPLQDARSDMDPDSMSPREALEALYRLKGLASPG
jgi:DNA mismatch repair protein MutS